MADINSADMQEKIIAEKGFLDIEVDPTLDIFSEIEKLKKEKMPSSWRIITRNPISRMWPIILAIVWV
jgi:hypothetical protein